MADLKELAGKVADQFGIPRNIFTALIEKESAWNPYATGAAGEVGLTQVKPTTAMEVGVSNPYTVEGNLQAGAAYLSKQYKAFGDWQTALSAYNAGPNNIMAGQSYASSVLNMAGISSSNSPGTQTISQASVIPGSSSTTSASTHPVVYIVVIGLIVLLLGFGTWSLVKG